MKAKCDVKEEEETSNGSASIHVIKASKTAIQSGLELAIVIISALGHYPIDAVPES